jgi:hypothetical protein
MNDADLSRLSRRGPRRMRGAACAVGLVVSCFWSRTTLAADEGDAAAAEALFREGKNLLELGDYDAACPKLAESYRLDPATGALLATALCYERAGRLASAWAAYSDAAARAKSEGNGERESSARARAALLEPRLPRLVVVASESAEQELLVLRDGIRMRPAAWGSPMPVDPGERVIEARASGKRPFRTTVRVIEGQETRVEIPPLEDAPAPVPSIAPASFAPEASGPAEAGASTEYWTGLRGAGAVIGGVGAVGLGVSAAFLTRALILKADSQKDCDSSGCGATGVAKGSDAVHAGNVATVAGIAGFALGATGLLLFVLGAPDGHETVAFEIAPVESGGLRGALRGSF